ncbi:MAG: hypothetical protein AAF901_13610, partial [Bacteroidota bacterium]
MRRRKNRSWIRMRRFFFWYPGGIWAKRILHLVIIYSISVNLYVSYIQHELFVEADCMAQQAEETMAQFQKAAEVGANTANNIKDILLWDTSVDWWTYQMVHNQGNEATIRVNEQRKIIQGYTSRLK